MIRPLKFLFILALIYCVKVNGQKNDKNRAALEAQTEVDYDEFILNINNEDENEEDLGNFLSKNEKKTDSIHKLSSKKEIDDGEFEDQELYLSKEILAKISKVLSKLQKILQDLNQIYHQSLC